MRQIKRITTVLGALMVLAFITLPAWGETSSTSPSCGTEAHVTVVATGDPPTYQAQPNNACIANKGHIYWDVDPDLTWVTIFVDDGDHSPFPPGHHVHHNGKSHEKVSKDCLKTTGDKSCSYSYIWVVVDSTGAGHIVDPTIIIKANTLNRPDSKKGTRAKPPSAETRKSEKK
jgi:hypothetical protein